MAQGGDQPFHGVAAHNGVIDNHQAFALNFGLDHVEFQVYFQLAQALIGLDKGAVAVAVLDDGLSIGNAGRRSITQRGGNRGVGYGYDYISLDGMLARQFAAQSLAHVIDVPAVKLAGRVREVDVLEDAQRLARDVCQYFGAHTLLIDDDKLAWFDFAHEIRADAVESARFRSHHPVVVDTPKAQRAHSPGVAHGVELAIRQHHHAICSAQSRESRYHSFAQRGTLRVQEQQRDGFAVGRGVQVFLRQFFAQGRAIDEVAVMGNGDGFLLPAPFAHDERACVLYATGAGGRVAHVADAAACLWQSRARVGEDFTHLAHTDTADNLAIVIVDRHARAFLAAMLQGCESQREIAAHVDVFAVLFREDAYHSAGVV